MFGSREKSEEGRDVVAARGGGVESEACANPLFDKLLDDEQLSP